MVSRAVYHRYRRLVESLGLRQLDVYRVAERDKEGKIVKVKDVVRIFDPSTSKVVTVDLGTTREALSYREFLEKIVEATEKAGVPLPERLVADILRRASEMDAASARAAVGQES